MRLIEFFDGFESSVAPDLDDIIATQLTVWPSDGAYEAGTDGTGDDGDLYLNSTSGQPRFYSGAWREFVTGFGNQTIGGQKTFSDNAFFLSNLTIDGDLIVQGNTVTLNTTILDVEDAQITVNKNGTQAAADGVAGLRVEMTDATDVILAYETSSESKFKIGNEGDEREVATVSHQQTLTEKFYDGGVASNSRAIRLPRETTTNLDALTDLEGLIAYDTTQGLPVYNDGLGWVAIGSGIAYQEPIGTGNGVNTSFGPLTYTPNSEDSIVVMRDGLVVQKSEWSLSGADILFGVAPAAAQDIYVYYPTQGAAFLPSLSGTLVPEYRELTVGEIAAKSLTLIATPATASKVFVDVIGGSAQIYGVDYTVSGATLDWNGLGMEFLPLIAGNFLRIWYQS